MGENVRMLQTWLRNSNLCRAKQQVKSSQIQSADLAWYSNQSTACTSLVTMHSTMGPRCPNEILNNLTHTRVHAQEKKKKKKRKANMQNIHIIALKKTVKISGAQWKTPLLGLLPVFSTRLKIHVINSHSLLYTLMQSNRDTKQRAHQQC